MRLTNLENVLWPETETIKGEVIHYYESIAPALLPHLAERPVTRKRWPDGVAAAAPPKFLFEKDLGNGVPDWVLRQTILHSVARSVTRSSTALELHVPQCRFDPGYGVGLAECAEVALWAEATLDGSLDLTYGSVT